MLYAPRMAEDLVGRLELVAELRRAQLRGRVRHPLPAGGRSRERCRRRRRGARPLGASDARSPRSRRVHPARGGDRQDRRSREVGPRRSLRAGRALARRDSGCRRAVPQRQRLDPAGAAGRARGERSLRARRIRAPSGGTHARAHRERARAQARGAAGGARRGRCCSAFVSRSTTSGRATRRSRSCRTSRSTR